MKLAFSTLGCPEWDFDAILHNASQMGFDAIELRGIGQEMRIDRMTPFQPGRQQQTLRRLQDAGLSVCCVGTSVRFDEPGLNAIEEGRAAIDVCARMGIPFIRVFGDCRRTGRTMEQLMDDVADGCGRLCEYADGTDVQILLEVHGDFDRAERILPVIHSVQSSHFGILWDIEHSDAVYGDQFALFYRELVPHVKHVHIKDAFRTPEGHRLCGTGEGDLPIAGVVHLLEAENYAGFFSLEWEKKWHPELPDAGQAFPQYVRYMRGL